MDESNINGCINRNGCININGCINRNVYSSMLFIIPTLYAYVLLPYYSELMVGSFLCLITSVYHHYYKAEIGFLKTLDRIVVNSIGFFLLCDV